MRSLRAALAAAAMLFLLALVPARGEEQPLHEW